MWKLFRQKEWWEQYDSKSQKLHHWFIDFFYTLTSKKGFMWLDVLVNTLCVLEVNLELYKDKELREMVNARNYNVDQIPKNTLYCEGCPFCTRSSIAEFFYGNQMHGYCHYLNRGDFTYGAYTDILWDGCKECGIHEDFDDTDDDYEDVPQDYSEYTKE